MKRVDIKAILADPTQRRELLVRCVIATQAREGITTTRAQAEAAVDKTMVVHYIYVDNQSGQFTYCNAPAKNATKDRALVTCKRCLPGVQKDKHAEWYRNKKKSLTSQK